MVRPGRPTGTEVADERLGPGVPFDRPWDVTASGLLELADRLVVPTPAGAVLPVASIAGFAAAVLGDQLGAAGAHARDFRPT
jgi:hypothetical protein